MCKKSVFKLIAFILIQAFLVMDCASANEFECKQTSVLSPKFLINDNQFQRIYSRIFTDSNIISNVKLKENSTVLSLKIGKEGYLSLKTNLNWDNYREIVEKLINILLKSSDFKEIKDDFEFVLTHGIFNAVIYGNKLDGKKKIILKWRINRQKIEFKIIDEGAEPFDFKKEKFFFRTKKSKVGGEGIALDKIASLMNETILMPILDVDGQKIGAELVLIKYLKAKRERKKYDSLTIYDINGKKIKLGDYSEDAANIEDLLGPAEKGYEERKASPQILIAKNKPYESLKISRQILEYLKKDIMLKKLQMPQEIVPILLPFFQHRAALSRKNLEEYYRLIKLESQEYEYLLGVLLESLGSLVIKAHSISYLFRDLHWLRPLEDYIDGLITEKVNRKDYRLRIKSLGGADGTEAYSILAVIYERLEKYARKIIFADIDSERQRAKLTKEWIEKWNITSEIYDQNIEALIDSLNGIFDEVAFSDKKKSKYYDDLGRQTREYSFVQLQYYIKKYFFSDKSKLRAKAEIRKSIKPIYSDFNDKSQLKLLMGKKAEVVFIIDTFQYLKGNKERENLKKTIAQSFNNRSYECLYVSGANGIHINTEIISRANFDRNNVNSAKNIKRTDDLPKNIMPVVTLVEQAI